VKKRGQREVKVLRSNFLLDAVGKNRDPSGSRPFDYKMQRDSPTKTLNKWCEKFGEPLRPKREELPPPPEPTNMKNKTANAEESEEGLKCAPTDHIPSMKKYMERGLKARKGDSSEKKNGQKADALVSKNRQKGS